MSINWKRAALTLFFLGSLVQAQKTDPYSTPPGAPMVDFEEGTGTNRLNPNHPGNAGQRVAANNFTIIESQSTMAAHNMDVQWQNVLTGMGHTATILPQTALDNTGFFGSTDVLIVSSGIIALPANRVTTIRQFMQTGKSVYIQGEYLTSYGSNQAFSTIMNATGGTFALGGTVSGDLVPTTILNMYSTTTNSVPSIGYHWYGATGSGCNNLEYFMRYNGNNIGYVYCPTNGAWGDVIQNTDQDWIRVGTSYPLMQNIVYFLLSGNACSVVCGTVLEANGLDLVAQSRTDGSVNLTWTLDGDVKKGRFVIEADGDELGEMEVEASAGLTFQFVDMRLPAGRVHYRVRHIDENGQETLTGEAVLDLGNVAPKLRVTVEKTGIRLWLSQAVELDELWMTDVGGKRIALNLQDIHSVKGQFVSMHGQPSGIYMIQAITPGGTSILAKALWMQP
jgi:hypothetical protein